MRLWRWRRQVISNLDEYGNTSAGTIPLALDQAVREGKIKPGDTIAMAGFGAGLSWGAAVVKWQPAIVETDSKPAAEAEEAAVA